MSGIILVSLSLIHCTPGVQSGDISSQFAGVQNARAISPTAVVIDWTKTSDYSSYEIYSNTQTTPLAESVFASSTIENLTPSTEYSFKVIGKGSNGVGGNIEYAVKTWPRFTGVERVFKNSDGAMVVEWNYSYPVDAYQVFYREETPPTQESTENWTKVSATTRENRYIFTKLKGSTTYYFMVHALYRGSEYERPTKSIAGATNSSFPLPYYSLPKITIGALPTIDIQPVVTDQFPATNYESRIYKDGVEIADPVRGAGKATFREHDPPAFGAKSTTSR
ncbi:MAG: hypothetical protein HC902_10005 [Calothrix sp. SM1_5_4]|nr:hypothetical protein [Calothrix sp. SM1_5_4]